jgi:hypothetical protein
VITESVPGRVSADALWPDSQSKTLGYFHIRPFSKPQRILSSIEVTESEPVVRGPKVATPKTFGNDFVERASRCYELISLAFDVYPKCFEQRDALGSSDEYSEVVWP